MKYHEPEFWKFGEEGNKYFRHATGQIYGISKDLASYISINRYVFTIKFRTFEFSIQNLMLGKSEHIFRPILHRFANEDVTLGAWLLGLDVEHVDERSMCCGTPPGNFIYNFTTCR